MPSLIKLPVPIIAASSIYGHPYKWVRTLSPSPSSLFPIIPPPPFPFSPSSNTTTTNKNNNYYYHKKQKISVRPWRTMTSCAPSAHLNKSSSFTITTNNNHLGFRGQKFSSSSNKNTKSKYSSSSSEERGKGERISSILSSPSDMGSENKDENWNQNNYTNGFLEQHKLSTQEEKPPKLLTLPTVLTLGRVAAVPLLVSTFYMDSWWGTTATTSIFIAAAITDWLDGYLARKMRLSSAFGAFLDPVADKLMVAATLVLLCTQPLNTHMFGQVPWLLTVPAIAIIGREITMSAVREWAASQDSKLLEAVAVNNLGKWKTATQMTALTILLATRDSSLAGPGVLIASGVVLLYVSAWLAVWSLYVYMRKISKVLLQ